MDMDADERDICRFLESFPGEFVSPREISRRAGGKHRFRENGEWATPALLRLVEKGFIEGDSKGYFRFVPPKEKQQKWIAPHLKQILNRSGKFKIESDET